MSSNPVYLDNAATSFPKPESVYDAVTKAMLEECGNHLAIHRPRSLSHL